MFSKDSQLNFIMSIIVIAGLLMATYFLSNTSFKSPFDTETPQKTQVKFADKISLKSNAFQNEGQIPVKYTCKGENINPDLEISNLPTGTQNLVIIMEDPDAPIRTFDHWVLFNINSKTTYIAENSIPTSAMSGQNDFGKAAYSGPCPVSGIHHYKFKIYALDKILASKEGVSKAELIKEMEGHILDRGVLVGTFGK